MKGLAENHNLPIGITGLTDCKIDMIYDQYHPDVLLLGAQLNVMDEQVFIEIGNGILDGDYKSFQISLRMGQVSQGKEILRICQTNGLGLKT